MPTGFGPQKCEKLYHVGLGFKLPNFTWVSCQNPFWI